MFPITNINKSTTETISSIKFEEIFKLEDIQLIQDSFSKASGVASVITRPDGTLITTPSNFCRLCEKIIHKTEKGQEMCARSNAVKVLPNNCEPGAWSCRFTGLWEAGAAITVGGQHIANWIIGQVRNELLTEQQLSAMACEVGVDVVEFREAYHEAPVMTTEEFTNVTKMLFSFARELSERSNTNLQLMIQTANHEKTAKALAETLKASEERYRSLFENMLNGCAYCQMIYEDGVPTDFLYLKVNKAFESSTGLKDVEGKRVTEVIPGFLETDGNLMEIYSRVALTGKPELFEMNVESLDDWYSISVYSPQKGYFIAVFDVITERKRAELELTKAKEKAEESDRLKTAFLNNISHEIRTPFNGILGLLSLIQDHDLEEEEREEYIGIINESADRLMTTINDIVEVSHIQSDQVTLTLQETNLKKLSDELFDRFNPFAANKKLEFTMQYNVPFVTILTDGTKLKSILSNLIGNALKFTKSGSVEMYCNMKGDFLEFQVKDTGIGISIDKQKVIFERFMQSNVSNTREFEGLGLGLTIAKAYVLMLGGELWLESEVGKGSTFYFTISYKG